MFNHINEKMMSPQRVVVLGAKGFIGSTLVQRLSKSSVTSLAIGREQIDLSQKKAADELVNLWNEADALVVIAAKAPCKNHAMLLQNIEMMSTICDALLRKPVSQVIYISSDAVYADSMEPLSEFSPTAPTSLHGVMHLAREKMLQSVVDEKKLAILRPTLVYGASDPHNGYGPNSFYRLIRDHQSIKLFGQGEEQRDHVYVEDVAELIYRCLLKRSYGILNLTTGDTTSFYEVATQLQEMMLAQMDIICTPRVGSMPHNGYRAFDNTTCHQAFPDFKYTSLQEGLNKMHNDYLKSSKGAIDVRN